MGNLELLKAKIKTIYLENKEKLPFHGWHHINFVYKKALEFAADTNADEFLIGSAALVHDLNYILRPESKPEEAMEYREQILLASGYSQEEVNKIESIIIETHTAYRGEQISEEGKCLSDADSLFKVLPITPVVFASNYLRQNGVDLFKMADKIVKEQNKLLENDIYFYTDIAKVKYISRAKLNLDLWNSIKDSFEDEDVLEVMSQAKELGVI